MLLLFALGGAPAVGAAPDRSVLVDERFDGPGLPAGWRVETGAAVGDGPLSALAVVDGALVATVRPEDRRFAVLLHEVPLGGARWVRVTARMRTEGVDPAPARFRNAHVSARFDRGPVSGLGVLMTGTHPWTAQARTYAVPSGAETLHVGLFLSMPGVAAFDDVEVQVVDPGWQVEEDGAYVYHLLPGDEVSRAARAENRRVYEENLAWFGLGAGPLVQYWKYPDRATKGEFTGNVGNGHADLGNASIHSIWERDRHEIVHLLALSWGHPPPLLGEGLAVWRSGSWQGAPIRSYAAKLGPKWIPLARLATAAGFRAEDSLVTYAQAGAFVGWLAETRGQGELRRIYETVGLGAGAAELEAALGMTLAAADDALRRWVGSER